MCSDKEEELLELSPTELEKLSLEIALKYDQPNVSAHEPDKGKNTKEVTKNANSTKVGHMDKPEKGVAHKLAPKNLVKSTAPEPANKRPI